MVLSQKETCIAYRCPDCGSGVMSMVGVFKLTAEMMKLKCTCASSDMTIAYSKDKKVRLTIPCIMCRTNHTYTVSQSVFFSGDLFALSCPNTAIDICFTGKQDEVKEALERSEQELVELFKSLDIDDPSSLGHSEEYLPDAQIHDIILFVLHELEADGKVSCPCNVGPYDIEVLPDAIRIFCRDCGAEKILPITSPSQAQEFLFCDSIELK